MGHDCDPTFGRFTHNQLIFKRIPFECVYKAVVFCFCAYVHLLDHEISLRKLLYYIIELVDA
jgi:hypothetical protein